MRILFLLSLLVVFWGKCHAHTVSKVDDRLHRLLFLLSSESLNYSTTLPEDSLICLCNRLGEQALGAKDYITYFKTEQIAVNSLCLQGDWGLALDKASKMYEEARKQSNDLGIALALQALGDTYMYTNRYEQADESFTDAFKILKGIRDDDAKIRLFIQYMHVCLHSGKIERLPGYMEQAEELIARLSSREKENYHFFVLCYRTLYYLSVGDEERAGACLEQVLKAAVSDRVFHQWIYLLFAQSYLMQGDYENALLYSDSVLMDLKKSNNLGGYIYFLKNKALIFEKKKQPKEAFCIYQQVNTLSDSVNMARYLHQLDELHLTYRIDQTQLDTAAEYNRLLSWIVFFCFLLLLTVIVVVIILKRKNRMLKLCQKHLEAETEKAVRSIQSKSLFLSNMSHEIRTPLNGIVGFSEVLATYGDIDAETKRLYGDNIRQNSDLLLKLINDLMDLSDLEENTMNFTFAACDAVDVCHNVINTVNAVKTTAAQLTFSCLFSHLELYTDRNRLQQVLINLLVNATKFTKEGSIRLVLDVDADKHEAVFVVEDTGCGIPPEKQKYIFNRYEKLHEGIQGSGLGLSICQLVIKRIRGRIWLDAGYTQGARFVFTHPLPQTSNE